MYATLEMNREVVPPVTTEESDEALFLKFRDTGDRRLLEVLVHRYERELFSYLRRILGDSELAADTFQTTFMHVLVRRDQFEEGRRFRPWMYAVATNLAIDLQRRNHRRRMTSLDRKNYSDDEVVGSLMDLLVSSTPDPLTVASQSEQRDWVREALQQLPENYRVPVQLVYYQGLTYGEAAEALGIPKGTVKSRVHAAILKLTEAWSQRYPKTK